ncbi:MAG: aldose epimerase family protein, partial [Paracoccaceae bacterium]
AKAMVAGREIRLEPNEGGNLLHSGPMGMQAQVWDIVETAPDTVVLGLRLDGDGFPGRRRVQARFSVEGMTLRLEVTATTDTTTLMNVAQHSYWNLGGTATWARHQLQIDAETYLPTQANLPTGEIRPVAGTALDFRQPRLIAPGDPMLDTNFCIAKARTELREVLWLRGHAVTLAFATTEPGVQVYDGAHGIRPGHGAYEGLAIEAQGWPDAPNHAGFPSVELHPSEKYHQITEWRFRRLAGGASGGDI